MPTSSVTKIIMSARTLLNQGIWPSDKALRQKHGVVGSNGDICRVVLEAFDRRELVIPQSAFREDLLRSYKFALQHRRRAKKYQEIGVGRETTYSKSTPDYICKYINEYRRAWKRVRYILASPDLSVEIQETKSEPCIQMSEPVVSEGEYVHALGESNI